MRKRRPFIVSTTAGDGDDIPSPPDETRPQVVLDESYRFFFLIVLIVAIAAAVISVLAYLEARATRMVVEQAFGAATTIGKRSAEYIGAAVHAINKRRAT